MKISLPYKFTPRPYQKEFYDTVFDYSSGKPIMKRKRGVIVRPRRHGKDKSIFNMLVIPEMLNKVGLYYYIFPEYGQARKAFWENIDNDGFKLLNHIPKELIANLNNSEMKIELKNGSILRVVGTDKNTDGIVGSNPVGVIFSERALCNPIIWDYIRPMLMANGGRAYFVYTPRGHNHGRDLFNTAKAFPDTWALAYKTAKETYDNNGERVFSDIDLKSELEQGMDEDLFQQEYMCSFEGALKGAIYSEQIKAATEQNRICKIAYEQALPVYTFWDLGMSDSMAILFVQFYGKEVRIIDHYEMSNKGFDHFIDIINNKGYTYQEHYLPHDGNVRELSANGLTRVQLLEKLGLKNVKTVPNVGVDTGISLGRKMFANVWIEEEKCARLLDCLKSYVYEYDEKNKIWSRNPKHDWASHSSDAYRYLAVMHEELNKARAPQRAITVDYSKYL